MDDFKNNIFTYIFVAILGCLSGALFVMRSIENVHIDTTSRRIRFVIYGIGSSMLITWIIFEICLFCKLPTSLSASIGGGAGFIGAEVISRLLIKYFKTRFKIDDTPKDDKC